MTHRRIERWISTTLAEIPVRTNSLIITIFGDAIAPHGGAAWLGGLIELLAPLGVNARAVRTSVFRLTQEDWLHAQPIGRRSVYGLTPAGQRRISHAYRRIYDTPHEPWNGEWQMVIIPDGVLPAKQREELRRDLLWEGYGALAPNVFAHPAGGVDQLRDVLQQTGSDNKVAVLKATTLNGIVGTPLRTLVHQCWHLDRLADDYRRFAERFGPPLKWLADGDRGDPQQNFVLRTLLIHEFRRIQLRDPQLPDSLLAADWPGHTARALCRELYALTLPGSEAHLLATLSVPEGRLPDADASLYRRFGGIAAGEAVAVAATERRRKGTGERPKALDGGAPARNRTRA
ncbi:phenylacetic acid degradation operon negative regulatory protein PaaX [Azospira restricta]|uniref:Phenylacetic acid degradation operon negative regulatory protein PaaX n=1 Tax=Azospira restricta TaxID=404405 RepID=A0A974SSC0_9RHOO|nr:phenylacetic acid degradation operon negative regulatory protein PaaX [Azospira restricta]QRJ65499.1 phenylacetic acid degradation operon negative regulatory protein PaaX [Azospira restricta]